MQGQHGGARFPRLLLERERTGFLHWPVSLTSSLAVLVGAELLPDWVEDLLLGDPM